MSEKRHHSAEECTREAIRLVTEHGSGVGATARHLGSNAQRLSRWKRAADTTQPAAFVVQDAWRMALGRRHPSAGLLHHAERGSQDASHAYQDILADHGIVCRMRGQGECLDGGLPLTPYFVGRKPELRALRHALREPHVTAAFVRGIGGLGKSSLVAKLIQRPGTNLDGVLVIRCHEVDASDVPGKLADFIRAQGRAGHAEAAAHLLDSKQHPAERARTAANLIADRRYMFVFDNFESVMAMQEGAAGEGQGEGAAYDVANPELADLLAGLLAVQWRSLCLFTGRYRWRAFDKHLGRGTAVERHLPALSPRQTIMLMDNLPRLRQEPLQTKIALMKKVGGHPKSIELLEGWLSSGRVTDLLCDPRLDGLLAQQWEEYFLRALLAQLTPTQHEAFARLSVFCTPLGDEEFTYAGVDASAVHRWLDLSLLERGGSRRYSIHEVLRQYLLGQMEPAARRALHTWAATYYGRPFAEIARPAAMQLGRNLTEGEIQAEARGGIVQYAVSQINDLDAARANMSRVLEWRHHLFAAEEYDAANDIVNVVYDILYRWGHADSAKAVLRESIATLEGFRKATAESNLANMLVYEGKLDEALATHEEVYRTFEALNAVQKMAAVLRQIDTVYRLKDEIDQGIANQTASLQLRQRIGDVQGQAISLLQLSMLHTSKDDYTTGMGHIQEAERLARQLGDDHILAASLQEQGLILTDLAYTAQNDEERRAHLHAAVERFQSSLGLKRRIGDVSGAADTLGELGKLLLITDRVQEAIAAFTEALATQERLGIPAKVGTSLVMLGVVHERQGEDEAALEKYQQALEILRQYGSQQDQTTVASLIAGVRVNLPEAK